jgi:hypothetical protein
MKKVIFLFLIMIMASCTDQFEKMPSDKLPSQSAITTVDDLSLALNGVYVQFVNRASYAGDFGLYADGKGGDTKYMSAYNHFSPITRYQHDATAEVPARSYQNIYTSLARINNILTVTDAVTVATGEEDIYDDLLGQLYALRALCHFDAARLFAQLPGAADDMNAPNSGIVLATEYYQPDAVFTRSTLQETYDQILNDLEASLPLLSRGKNYGKINYWAARAIESRVELYLENYDEALSYANEVINNNAGYTLYEINEYINAWKKTATSESLFEIVTTDNVNAARNSIGYYTIPAGYCEVAATDDFADWLRADPNDVRSNIIAIMSDDGDFLAWYPVKYLGQEGASTPSYVNNPKIIRLSEVYLIAAEARLKGGNATGAMEAVDYYNTLRSKRITGYSDAATITLDDILQERRRELFCENHRFFDLVRNRMSVNAPIVQLDPIPYDDPRMIIAIPKRELDISPDLRQNPGY